MSRTDYSMLDMALLICDGNEESENDNLLCGLAIRKEDAEEFIEDICRLAEEKFGGARFSELMECDLEDEAIAASFARWRQDAEAR